MSESNLLNQRTRVLFISVHPDDETFGCGGTILSHKAAHDQIYWLNISGGDETHPFGFSPEMLKARDNQIDKVNSLYGFHDFVNLSLPTQMLDTLEVRIMVNNIDQVFNKWKPNIVYFPNRSDVHSDHRVAFSAIYSCTKNFRKPYIKKMLMYETLSETEFAPALIENAFVPNLWVDVTDFFDMKLQIAQVYDTELMPDPYPRSIHALRGLGAYRGSRIGVRYAEAFVSIFEAR